MPKKTFTVDDLQRWQEKGLLSAEQLQRILTDEELESPPKEPEKKKRINPVIVAYYFGGFLALISFTIFITVGWEDFAKGERLAIILSIFLVLSFLGILLRFVKQYHIPGGILLFIAAAVFPLFVYTVADLSGLWPERGSWGYAVLYLSLISLPIPILILVLTRFYLVTLVVAGLVHAAVLAIGDITSADTMVLTAVTCGFYIVLALGLTFRWKGQQTFWLKLYSLVGLYFAFINIFLDSFDAFYSLIFLAVYLIFIVISIWRQEIIFLVFGIIGVYTYIIRLSVEYLDDTIAFPLVLGAVGISIVVLAVIYQRYRGNLFRRKA